MGYSHYWRREAEFGTEPFSLFANDVRLLHEASRGPIPLAGPHGTGDPEIGPEGVFFNGVEACGHPRRDLGITWPAEDAGGVNAGSKPVAGGWFAGAMLRTRTCDGDCSHESFWFPRVMDPRDCDGEERPFQFCKTAYKPYDVLVTAALIAAKHRFGDAVSVSSDGGDKDWFDGQMLCQQALGYGLGYNLEALGR